VHIVDYLRGDLNMVLSVLSNYLSGRLLGGGWMIEVGYMWGLCLTLFLLLLELALLQNQKS